MGMEYISEEERDFILEKILSTEEGRDYFNEVNKNPSVAIRNQVLLSKIYAKMLEKQRKILIPENKENRFKNMDI